VRPHLSGMASCLTAGMDETVTEANKLWGIYHTDREYAPTVDGPLRTIVEDKTTLAARLGVLHARSSRRSEWRGRFRWELDSSLRHFLRIVAPRTSERWTNSRHGSRVGKINRWRVVTERVLRPRTG
jgi:hypothetical protein